MWLSTVVLITLLQHGAANPPPLPWYSNAVYYRILVDSFKDSNGDGLGDLPGTTKQLSYVKALGADAVVLSPISSKNTDCSAPGTLDFADIDQRYGDIDKFKALIEKAKKLELKVVLTLTLQRLSVVSDVFKNSVANKLGYEDYFVWRAGDIDQAPQAEEGIDSWTWDEDRKAYWGSTNKEAVLNLCSEGVVAMLSDVQCTWLKRAVDGILFNPDFLNKQDCGVQLLKKLVASAVGCSRAANIDAPVILVESSLGAEFGAQYYGDGVGANTVISNTLTTAQTASNLAIALHAALIYTPQDMTPTWLTSTSNGSRVASRHGNEMVDAMNLLALILPGSVIIQQGDELGAADTLLEWASISNCWPSQVIPSAAPFPWDDTPKASFTTGEPWLPLAPNYRYANAKTEYANDLSHVGVMRVASAMRKSPAIGPHVEIKIFGDALAVLRWGGSGTFLVISNLGRGQSEVLISRIPGLPPEMTVAASSGGSSLSPGSHVNLDKPLKLATGESALLAGPARHCGGPGPVDKIANKLSEGWQKLNKYFSNL